MNYFIELLLVKHACTLEMKHTVTVDDEVLISKIANICLT